LLEKNFQFFVHRLNHEELRFVQASFVGLVLPLSRSHSGVWTEDDITFTFHAFCPNLLKHLLKENSTALPMGLTYFFVISGYEVAKNFTSSKVEISYRFIMFLTCLCYNLVNVTKNLDLL